MNSRDVLRIRRAARADLDTLVPLFDAYRRFYAQAADPAGARAYLDARLSRDEAVVLLAGIGGDVAGFTLLYPGFSSVRMARAWLLNDLFVAQRARRRGIGRALLQAAAEHAREQGAHRISLETGRDNRAAQALYRSAGWHEDATQWFTLELHRS